MGNATPGVTDARSFQNILHAFESEILTHGEAELGVLATRADEFVRISFYARSNAHVNILRNAQFLGNGGNAAQFNTGVNNNAPHTSLDGFTQFLRGFVVAMNYYTLGREARSKRAGKFATTRNIRASVLPACIAILALRFLPCIRSAKPSMS